jgi:transcriptional regulator with XRE-family HTH domain
MSVISKRFADELAEKRMRDAYLSAQTRTKLTNQIRAIRNQRGWSQGQFAKILGKPQSNVSRLENREYGNFSLNTLFELASAFDVGLVVEFVPYDQFLRRTKDLSARALQMPSFSANSLEPLSRDEIKTAAMATVTTPMPLDVFANPTALDSQLLISLAWHDIGTRTLADMNTTAVRAAQASITGGIPLHQTERVDATQPVPPQTQAATNQTFVGQEFLSLAAE